MATKPASIKKRLEYKIRKQLGHTTQHQKHLKELALGACSVDEIFQILARARGNPTGGRIIRSLLRESKKTVSDPLAIDLLMWTFMDAINQYCRNVHSFNRNETRQEGYVALVDSARHFRSWTVSNTKIWEVFACMITARMSVARDIERKQQAVATRFATFVAVVGHAVAVSGGSSSPNRSIRFLPEERLEAVYILKRWTKGKMNSKVFRAWVANRIFGETTGAYAARRTDSKKHISAWTQTRKRVARFSLIMRKTLRARPLVLVADDCLLLSGKGDFGAVPVVRFHAMRRELSRARVKATTKGQGDAHG